MRGPGDRHRGAGAGGRLPPRDAAERDRFGMTGRGYEQFDPDDFDRPVNLGGTGSPPPGPMNRVGFDPGSQRHGDYGDYGDYGDELGTTTPMRAFYEGQLSSVGGGPAPRGRRGRGYGAYEGGEPRTRSGTDAVDYDRGYTSARRGPYADYRDYQARPDRGLYSGQGGSIEEADAHRTGRDQEPDYRGRGPRNYRRTDARISEDVHDRLTDDPHVDASEISVRVEDGEVTLDGTVASRTMKRRAEDLSDSVSGVTHTQNNLRVVRHAEGGRTTFGEASGAREPGSIGREPPEEPATGPRTGQRIGDTGTAHGSGRATGER